MNAKELRRAKIKLAASEQKLAELKREVEREEREVAHMTKWVEEQRAAGRPEHELTWGNCVKETGIWKPNPVN
jgi:hypothetical protein